MFFYLFTYLFIYYYYLIFNNTIFKYIQLIIINYE